MTMDDLIDDLMDEDIEACRTCGVYYLLNSNTLRKLFQSHLDYPEMKLVHSCLSLLTSEIHENDGFSQFICTGCILEFKRVSLFKSSIDTVQSQFRELYNIKQQNIKIKTEIPEPEETNYSTTFIYVDDLSDEEYDGKTPFLAPHQPIKEEIIEGAAVPNVENSNNFMHMTTTTTTTTNAGLSIEKNGLSTLPPSSKLQMETENIVKNANTTVAGFDISKQLKCNLCPHLAKNELMLQQHTQRFHNKKDHSCHICGKVIENFSPNRLRFHMKWHKINKYIKCPQCGFHCESKETLQEHKLAVHSKVKCDFCHKLVLITSLTAHKRLHNNQVEWPCFFCNNVFNTEEARDDHIMATHNDEEDRIYELDDDAQSHQSLSIFETNDMKQENATTTAAIDIKQELAVNYNITSFNYDIIDHNGNDDDGDSDTYKIYENNTSLISSNNDTMTTDSATETEAETKVEIETNGLNASFESIEQKEVLTSQYECAKCKKLFDNINVLIDHAKSHTFSRHKQFPCKICGESFDLKFRLNRHLKKHKK